jgi:putative transposase
LPLLTAGLIRPAEGKRPAQKDYRVIKEQVRQLRAELADADAFMAMTNVVEQACNRYLQTEAFPATYEDMQPVPVLSVGQPPVQTPLPRRAREMGLGGVESGDPSARDGVPLS